MPARHFPKHIAVKLTVRRFSYTLPVRLLSDALGPLSRSERWGKLGPEAIANAAFAQVGGDPDRLRPLLGEEFDEAMTYLSEGPFTPLGRIHWKAILVSAAVGRLRLEQYLAEGRKLGEVKDPIFVVGLPRTGTSLVQRLIATDPGRRGLRTNEMLTPIVSPEPSAFDAVKRYGYAVLSYLIYKIFTPELIRIHHTSPTSLEECWMLFMPSYAVLNADYILPTPEFGNWLERKDMTGPYERYRQLLEILALSSSDRPYVLKSPEHLWFLDDLRRAFPGARVIWTHRDPAAAVASYAAQMSLPHRQHRGSTNPSLMGQRVLERFESGIARAERASSDFSPGTIAHVRYEDLTSDPVLAIERAYRDLGLSVQPAHERRMREFLSGPQLDRNQNHYLPETFGLTAASIRERFSGYIGRFRLEPSRSALISAPALPLLAQPTRRS